MVDLSYIDKFYDKVVRNLPDEELDVIARGPASEGIKDPNSVLRPLGAQMTQKEPTMVITGDAPRPIEYPTGYKPRVPESEIIRDNANYAIEARQKDAKGLGKNLQDMSGEYGGYKGDLKDALNDLKTASEKQYTPNAELENELQKAKTAYGDIKDVPERDMLSELILSFGPAVLGGLSGESGMIAQKPATTEARAMFEGRRKEQVDRVKSMREAAQKRYDKLLDMKNKDRESFDKTQQREMDRIKVVLSGTGDLAKMAQTDLNRTEDKLNNINKEVSEDIQKGATDIAKMERSEDLEGNKDKRAKIMAGIAQQKANQPTEGERKGAFQLGLMQQAEQNMQDLKKKYGNYPSLNNKWFRFQKNIASGMFGTTMMSDFLNSGAIDEPTRQQIQAELSFLEGIGRIQSGAAINIGEWSQMREQYFPTFGDSNEAQKVKEQQRQKALEGVNIIAGRAAPSIKAPVQVVSKDAFPRIVRKGSQQATVSNEKELKEAQNEGWK